MSLWKNIYEISPSSIQKWSLQNERTQPHFFEQTLPGIKWWFMRGTCPPILCRKFQGGCIRLLSMLLAHNSLGINCINRATVICISALLLWICLDTATNSQHLNPSTLHVVAMTRTAYTHSIHIPLAPLSFIQTAYSSSLSVIMHIITCSHG